MTIENNDTLDELSGGARSDGGTLIADSEERDPSDNSPLLETNGEEDVGTEPEEPADPTIDIDQVFEVLKNQRRRYVLEYLLTVNQQVRLGELAEQIAAWEYDKDKRAITSQERKRVYVGLYQCHLPKMDDVGAVSYNKPRGKIEPGENIDFFQRYLPIEQPDSDQSTTAWSTIAAALPFF